MDSEWWVVTWELDRSGLGMMCNQVYRSRLITIQEWINKYRLFADRTKLTTKLTEQCHISDPDIIDQKCDRGGPVLQRPFRNYWGPIVFEQTHQYRDHRSQISSFRSGQIMDLLQTVYDDRMEGTVRFRCLILVGKQKGYRAKRRQARTWERSKRTAEQIDIKYRHHYVKSFDVNIFDS